MAEDLMAALRASVEAAKASREKEPIIPAETIAQAYLRGFDDGHREGEDSDAYSNGFDEGFAAGLQSLDG